MATYKRGSGNYKSSFINVIIKTVDEGRTTSPTLANDSELKYSIRAGKSYFGTVHLMVKAHATPDFKFTFRAMTGGATYQLHSSDSSVPVATTAFGSSRAFTCDDTIQSILGHFWVRPTASEVLNFQWAQTNSDANSTNVLAGSTMTVYEA